MPDKHEQGEDREKEERTGQEGQVEEVEGKTRNRLTEHEMGILKMLSRDAGEINLF